LLSKHQPGMGKKNPKKKKRETETEGRGTRYMHVKRPGPREASKKKKKNQKKGVQDGTLTRLGEQVGGGGPKSQV